MNALVSIDTTAGNHTTTLRRPIVRQDGKQRALTTNPQKRSYRLELIKKKFKLLSLVAACCYLSFVQFSCVGIYPRRTLLKDGFSKWKLSTWGDDEPASGAFTCWPIWVNNPFLNLFKYIPISHYMLLTLSCSQRKRPAPHGHKDNLSLRKTIDILNLSDLVPREVKTNTPLQWLCIRIGSKRTLWDD